MKIWLKEKKYYKNTIQYGFKYGIIFNNTLKRAKNTG